MRAAEQLAVPLEFDLPLFTVTVAALLHMLGERRLALLTRRAPTPARRARSRAFYCGLAVVALSLAGPLDDASSKLLWAHMVQHVLLLTVAPPLIVFGAPWMSIWRPLPLALRRRVARSVARSSRWRPLRRAARALGQPGPAFIFFNLNLALWHVPGIYDLTLRSPVIHDLEHISFVVSGIVLWAQVIDSPPLRATLTTTARAYYMAACAATGSILALVLALASSPVYPAYAVVAHRPGGISALADQQLAAAVMLVPGSLTMAICVFALYRRAAGPEPVREAAKT